MQARTCKCCSLIPNRGGEIPFTQERQCFGFGGTVGEGAHRLRHWNGDQGPVREQQSPANQVGWFGC